MSTSKSIVERDLGGATVEVSIPSDSIAVGNPTDVEVRLGGRDVTRTVRTADLTLTTPYRTGSGYRWRTADPITLATDLVLADGLVASRTTTVTIPYEVPGTPGGIDVLGRFEFVTDVGTEVVETYLDVPPPAKLFTAFFAMFDLGFALDRMDCVADRFPGGYTCVPRFGYRPTDGHWEGAIGRVDVYARQHPEELVLFVVADETDPTFDDVPAGGYGRTTIHETDEEVAAGRLRDVIEDLVE